MVSSEKQLKGFFDHLDEISQLLASKEPFIFLDYDGTLTPIVATPDLAVMSDEMRNTVKALASKYKVAIVSGRATDDVRSKVQIEGIFYAGSHGFEIVEPDGTVEINSQAQEIRSTIDEVHARLSEGVRNIKGTLIEHVKYTVSCHYRLVSDEDFPEFKRCVDEIVARYDNLRMTSGKMVFEVRPNIDWHKGKAVEWIMDVLQFDANKNVTLYIGDDTTDEDAFAAMEGKGLGVLVAEEPRETKAGYLLNSTEDVKKAMEYLVNK